MPLYDARLNKPDGLLPEPMPGFESFPRFGGCAGRLLDANGAEIPYVLRCNTETGHVERYDVTDGRWKIDPASKRVVVLLESHPAPLYYVPATLARGGVCLSGAA